MAAVALTGSIQTRSRLTARFPFVPPFSKETDHVTSGLDHLIEQFKNKPILEGLLTAYLNQHQDLEDASFEVLEKRFLGYAEGATLDEVGSIPGEERQGRSDVIYREAISVRILINKCTGTPEEIIAIFKILTNQTIDLKEYFPAAFELTLPDYVDLSDLSPTRMKTYLNASKPAGVKAHLVYHTLNPFQFDTGLGFDQGHYGGAI